MDQKKSKHPIIGGIFHYLIVAIVLGAVLVAYFFDSYINAFFATPIFGNTTIDGLWAYIPRIIHAIQISGIMYLGVFVTELLMKSNIGLTDKAKTIFKVIVSIIKWVVIVGCTIWMLYALGVNAWALLISAGVITLIVGLSAQSLISDVIAGLFIVIEGEYSIDDIVVIDGYRGKVKSVGVRTTSIVDIGGNVKIINNSEIKTVVNLTNHKSLAKVTIYIASSENLKEVEQLFIESAPMIKEKLKEYQTGDIIYKGVNSMDNNGMALFFVCECFEEDVYDVERSLYREFKYIMDEHNISNNEPTVIYDRTEEFNKKKELTEEETTK